MIEIKTDFKLDEQKLKNIENFLAKNHLVNVGVLANEIRPEGFGSVELAMVHEFGSQIRKIPKRSFFIMTMTNRMKDYEKEITANLPTIMRRIADGQGEQFLQKVGAMWVRYVMETFDAEGPGWDSLSPKTIANRRLGSDKILQDTGEMKKSITFKVVE